MSETSPNPGVEVAALAEQIVGEVGRVIVGKTEVLYEMLAAFLAGGNVLLEDYPGLAKTLIANSFASVMEMSFRRIQFTPSTVT